VTELAKIGFANIRDYWSERIDLHRFAQDRTAARRGGYLPLLDRIEAEKKGEARQSEEPIEERTDRDE
jgi:hypothetical protein